MRTQPQCINKSGTPCYWVFSLLGSRYCRYCWSCKRSPYKIPIFLWMIKDKYEIDDDKIGFYKEDK